jgi:hypothetical protein
MMCRQAPNVDRKYPNRIICIPSRPGRYDVLFWAPFSPHILSLAGFNSFYSEKYQEL